MRPEKANYIINQVMQQWYVATTKPFTYPNNFLEALNKWIEQDTIALVKLNCYRDYIYEKDAYEDWRDELFYISDRWRAHHRVVWLKFGIENNRFI